MELPYYTERRRNNLGFSHMAAAVLAAKHFNDRDISVVPELNMLGDCKIQFDLNISQIFDTGIVGKQALIQMQSRILQKGPPCAVAGPYFDGPAKDLSVLSSSVQIPIVIHRGIDIDLLFNSSHPFLTLSSPAMVELAGVVISFLQSKGRTNYIAILHAISDTALQITQILTRLLKNVGMTSEVFGYVPEQSRVQGALREENDMPAALRGIKDLGFRTIVVISEEIDLEINIPKMADSAEASGVNNGEHLWVFYSGLPLVYATDPKVKENANITKLLGGAALVMPSEGFLIDESNDRFLVAWRDQDVSFVELLKSFNPILEGMPGYYAPEDDYFLTVDPEAGAGYLYDAVISIGIGACLASKKSDEEVIDGRAHLQGIQSSEFSGASGRVTYGEGEASFGTGIRDWTTAYYGAFNLLPPGENSDLVLTDILIPANASDLFRGVRWIPQKDFIYADGRKVPPYFLRGVPEQNYLSPSVRAVGFSLFSISAFLILLSAIWIVLNRNQRVLTAAQPFFLLAMCVGAMCESLPIVLTSFDESYGCTPERLGRLCTVAPWLLCFGHIVTYGALFGKVGYLFCI
jgi:hypothetical protein